MRNIRRLWRLCWLLPLLVLGVGMPALITLAALGRPGARIRLMRRTTRRFFALLAWLIGLEIDVVGPHPPAPALLCPNHLGYIDVVTLGAVTETLFLSRADAADWPLVGRLARGGGTLFVDRALRRDAYRVQEEIAERFGEGHRVVVFLEGRAGPGDDVRPFKSTLVAAAVASGSPCVPIRLTYTLPDDPDLPVGTTVAWADDTSFSTHAWGLLAARRIHVRVEFGAPRTGTERKQLANDLWEDVRGAVNRFTTSRDWRRRGASDDIV